MHAAFSWQTLRGFRGCQVTSLLSKCVTSCKPVAGVIRLSFLSLPFLFFLIMPPFQQELPHRRVNGAWEALRCFHTQQTDCSGAAPLCRKMRLSEGTEREKKIISFHNGLISAAKERRVCWCGEISTRRRADSQQLECFRVWDQLGFRFGC